MQTIVPSAATPARPAPAPMTTYAPQPDVVQWSQNREVDTLPEMFRRAVAANPQGNYLGTRSGDDYHYLTYQQAQEKVHEFASGLIRLGIQPRDRVAQLSVNRPEWVITDMGVMHAGAVHAPLYFKDADETIAYQLKDTGARVVVVDGEETLKKVIAAEARLPNLEHIVVMEPTALQSSKNLIQWNDFLQSGKEQLAGNRPEIDRRVAALKGTDVASMVYTSGSTGIGKGVMLSHANWVSNVEGVTELAQNAGALKPTDVELSFLPLSHIFERSVYYAVTSANAAIAYARSPKTLKDDMQVARPALVPCVPMFLDKISEGVQANADKQGRVKKWIYNWAVQVGREHFEARTSGEGVGCWLGFKHKIAHALVFSKIEGQMGGNLRLFISGGAPLAAETADFLNAVGIPVSEGYGMSECLVLTANPPDRPKPGTVGKPIKNVELRLSQEGEIQVRGPMIMNGYLGKEEKTRESFTDDGWLKTGDLGKLDADGYLSIVGRMKDQDVLQSGKKVQTGPIEEQLVESEFIAQAVLCGHGRPVEGAVVVPQWDTLTAWAASQGVHAADHSTLLASTQVQQKLKDEVKKQCESLSDYEKVKVVVLSSEDFTEANGLTTTGGLKVKRGAVLERFKDKIEEAYNRGKE
ncbi:MAG: long-chain fatty acid--CoA ligase [Candidatus Eremiobacterota bacterium]